MGRDQVSELLVAAALRGQRQITGTWKEGDGLCAVGVLLDALPEAWVKNGNGLSKGLTIGMSSRDYVVSSYGISNVEISRIVCMNDEERLDFLTIARKWENKDA